MKRESWNLSGLFSCKVEGFGNSTTTQVWSFPRSLDSRTIKKTKLVLVAELLACPTLGPCCPSILSTHHRGFGLVRLLSWVLFGLPTKWLARLPGPAIAFLCAQLDWEDGVLMKWGHQQHHDYRWRPIAAFTWPVFGEIATTCLVRDRLETEGWSCHLIALPPSIPNQANPFSTHTHIHNSLLSC